ncbi:chemotaxis protein CheW [Rhodanobacter lindaniclasticus]
MLLPNATIAEVVTHSAPEPIEGAPPWLLGRIAWRGWRVPLVSFTRLAGTAEGDSELVVRVAVLKALGGDPRLPFIAVQTQGFPRLTTLNAELIIPTHDGKGLPDGVRAHVLVRDDVAMIPIWNGSRRTCSTCSTPATPASMPTSSRPIRPIRSTLCTEARAPEQARGPLAVLPEAIRCLFGRVSEERRHANDDPAQMRRDGRRRLHLAARNHWSGGKPPALPGDACRGSARSRSPGRRGRPARR